MITKFKIFESEGEYVKIDLNNIDCGDPDENSDFWSCIKQKTKNLLMNNYICYTCSCCGIERCGKITDIDFNEQGPEIIDILIKFNDDNYHSLNNYKPIIKLGKIAQATKKYNL